MMKEAAPLHQKMLHHNEASSLSHTLVAVLTDEN